MDDLFVKKYSNTVYRLALSYTKNRYDAEDIMNEVFLRYLRKPREFVSLENEKAWFIRVTINCAKSFFLSAWQRKTVLTDEPQEQSEMEDAMRAEEVYSAVMSLPKNQRLCIHLFYYEQLSIKEISYSLGMPQSTVKSHLHRARAVLGEMLKGEYENVE